MATAFALFITQGWSQSTGTEPSKDEALKSAQQAKPSQGTFTDKNNNGICDNFEARGKAGQGKNFEDKNGDGKCDNCKGNCNGQGKGDCNGKGTGCVKQAGQGCCGQGQGHGHRHRHGCQGTDQVPSKPAPETQEKK